MMSILKQTLVILNKVLLRKNKNKLVIKLAHPVLGFTLY
jgi:hypothetical protein